MRRVGGRDSRTALNVPNVGDGRVLPGLLTRCCRNAKDRHWLCSAKKKIQPQSPSAAEAVKPRPTVFPNRNAPRKCAKSSGVAGPNINQPPLPRSRSQPTQTTLTPTTAPIPWQISGSANRPNPPGRARAAKAFQGVSLPTPQPR
jgi:hypothetical protein